MNISYKAIPINPIHKTTAVGFITNTLKTSKVQNDLYLYYIRFKDQIHDIVIISLDSLGVDIQVKDQITATVRQLLGPQVQVIISCTHTHYAPSLTSLFGLTNPDFDYLDWLLKQLLQAINQAPSIDGDFEVSYCHHDFNQVGQSRLSQRQSNQVYAGVLSLYHQNKRFLSFVFYNCHPTILEENPGYLSSEYPGVTLDLLRQRYPDEFFVFLQGSAGDVSTRFTRHAKTEAEMHRLAQLMAQEFDDLLTLPVLKTPLTLNFHDFMLTLHYQAKELQAVDTTTLSSKEIRELETAKTMLQKVHRHATHNPSTIIFSLVTLGNYKLWFHPFEMFSGYNSLIDRTSTLLIGYSQGYLSYLPTPDFQDISYESLIDITSQEDKEAIVKLLGTAHE